VNYNILSHSSAEQAVVLEQIQVMCVIEKINMEINAGETG
jgi:hypothetical protein